MTFSRILASVLIFAAVYTSAPAQNIILKDGKVIATKGMRRQGDTIVAKVELPGSKTGVKGQTGELGYPISQIAKLDFPEPLQIAAASALLVQGKSAEALAQIEPVVRFFESFRDAPGSWWSEAALLKVQALLSLKRHEEVEPIVSKIALLATDPETVRAARVQLAAAMTRKGDHDNALPIYETILKESIREDTLAAAAVNKGDSHLAEKEYEAALLAYLQIPVFYPDQKVLIPQSMLGTGRAYAALQDFERAKSTLNELISSYTGTNQADEARAELQRIERAERALEDAR